MFGQSLLSAFGIACTTDTDQLFVTNQSDTSIATYQLNNATTSIPNNTYPGTPNNITYTTGKFGDAAVFNGSNGDIAINTAGWAGTPASGSDPDFTISMWINWTSLSMPVGSVPLIGRNPSGQPFGITNINVYPNGNAYSISLERAVGTTGYYSSSYNTNMAYAFQTGVWYNLVIVYTGGSSSRTAKVYINNSLQASYVLNASYPATFSNDQNLGVTAGTYFNGKMDQIRFFNTALPQAAITALYNETTTTATSASIDYQFANPNSIAYYKMSDATDQLGNHDGTPTNVNFSTEGKFGFAGAFNGSSSYMQVNSIFSSNPSAFSVSVWFKTTSNGNILEIGSSSISSAQNRIQLYNGTLYVSLNGGNGGFATTSATGLQDGNWHHIVAVWDDGSVTNGIKIYIDGASTPTAQANSTQSFNSTSTLFIGANNDYSAGIRQYFDGTIDQIRIYDSVLSAADVSTLYNEVECQPAAINALANFNTVLYTGDGSAAARNITTGFKPGLTWIKGRNTSGKWNVLYDALRGPTNMLSSNATNAAQTYGSVTPFGTGFTLATTGGDLNTSGEDYVSWNWNAALANLSTSFNGSSTVGSASRIDLTGSTTLTTRSISLWVNLAGTGSGGNLILDNSDGQNPGVVQYGKWVIQLQYGGTNYFCWDTYNGSSYGICDVNYTFNLNTWYHIVFVAEANNQAVYINGVSQTLQNVSRPGDIGTVTMSTNRLGASWSTQYTHALNGTMGQVRIFNDALTASEVSDLYTEPATSNNTLNYPAGAGCIAAYPLQTDAVDLSGNYSGASSNVTFGEPGYLAGDGIGNTIAANPEAGFSIVRTVTGTSTSGPAPQYGEFKYNHGLNSAPILVFAKSESLSRDWECFFYEGGSTVKDLALNDSRAAYTYNVPTQWSGITSTYVHGWNYPNANTSPGDTMITYNFADVEGYSKIGSYIGNGSSNPIYVGFQPRFVMAKQTTGSGGSWLIMDSDRGANKQLYPNLNSAEYSDTGNSFSSTGFTMKSNGNWNNSGQTYIFLAIA